MKRAVQLSVCVSMQAGVRKACEQALFFATHFFCRPVSTAIELHDDNTRKKQHQNRAVTGPDADTGASWLELVAFTSLGAVAETRDGNRKFRSCKVGYSIA